MGELFKFKFNSITNLQFDKLDFLRAAVSILCSVFSGALLHQ